jgi:pyruvate kinase
MMAVQILCTLGPASMNDRVIARLEELGVNLFRFNLSHIKVENLQEMIEYLQSRTAIPVCLDTEGAQIRTGYFVEDHVVLRENSTIRIPRHPVPGDSRSFNLYPTDVIDRFRVGDYLTIDTTVLVQVVEVDTEGLAMRVLTGGPVGRNKATTLEREILLDPLTEKDYQALALGKEMRIQHVALSFANRPSDVEEIRRLSAPGAFVISKIECLGALTNLAEIAAASDALLIDRGDLSRQVPHERIPLVQKRIIGAGKHAGIPVYVATNLMESMRTEPVPTHAEGNDVFTTLLDGAGGLVLAAETAVGKFPINCASMVRKLITSFEQRDDQDVFETHAKPISLLVAPHGQTLVQRHATPADLVDLDRLESLALPLRDLIDAEFFAVGTHSPLEGFMDRATLESVLAEHRLPDGVVWPMPLVLPIPAESANRFGAGDRIALRDETGAIRSLLDVSEIFSFDFSRNAAKWFGPDATDDPRIARLCEWHGRFAAGRVTLVAPCPPPSGHVQMTPLESRYVLNKKGWNRTLSFHTHSLPNRGHEEILRRALEATHADGIFVSVETGSIAADDFAPALVTRCYQMLMDFGLSPRRNILLGASATGSRGKGVREALFLALCRKNMGFSHMILGRTDTERGRATRALFDLVGPLGIEPIFFETLGYEPAARAFRPLGEAGVIELSGAELRDSLRSRKRVPTWLMHSVIQDFVLSELGSRGSRAVDAYTE